MENIAGWVALAATCVAALMTASNLGARVTGWGFVVFTIGAVAWIVVGLKTGQTQLLWSNVFLGVVDVFGIWRWLGRRAKFSDAADAEQARSEHGKCEPLFSISRIDGLPVTGVGGQVIAHSVDALATCAGGTIDYFIVREGGVAGVGETLRRLPRNMARVRDAALETNLDTAALALLTLAETR
ncbi:PRC-barrel domain containing protein [Sphingomonas sp. RHCKR47]|uniref:PRC-barrel domain containing protein n=1 Tax=Sphingomonas citricola TaxID=2862498 RepID=UPI001CA55E8E|nr:PRC-barrel domain containing protein [Sphingomonas citricola]MBW6523124.1 PRC-barrel domain containing protein [Sphingomonas citricola]